jgi:hypothetical protein
MTFTITYRVVDDVDQETLTTTYRTFDPLEDPAQAFILEMSTNGFDVEVLSVVPSKGL